MAIWSRATHHVSSRVKRINLTYMVAVAVLCSVSYLIGVSRRGGAVTSVAVSCETSEYPSVKVNSNRESTATAAVTLDFTARHSAEGEIPVAEEARAAQFPPCDVKFSEYTPCQDSERSLRFAREMLIYRERHCPEKGELLKCRIPAPHGYTTPFRWPESRDVVWYANVPHKHLTVEKAGQNWVRFKKDRFSFPGGGTMFPRGAGAYIDEIGSLINLRDGSVRTAIDTGCGVASFGAYLLSRDILPMSFAPKDTHEAQVQFALERGVPAMIGIMASQRLPYPARSFDLAHCSRCLIPWSQYEGLYLIEVDRILRPGGYWILSGPPVNWQTHWKGWNRTRTDLDDEQKSIESVAKSLCWKKLAQRNDLAVWQKATNHLHCKRNRKVFRKPAFCEGRDPDKAWDTKMEACLTPLPEVSDVKEVAGGQLANWPERLTAVPPRIQSRSVDGVTAEAYQEDTKTWKRRVDHYKSIDSQLAEKGRYRNLLDMNARLGGFAAALVGDPVWVMNVVPAEAQTDTLGVIYERGLIGTYHNWCEAMSTYPRTYDFIHADAVFSLYKDRCEMEDVLLEMDRVLRPEGSVIIRDDVDVIADVQDLLERLEWESRMTDHEDGPLVREKILIASKKYWTAPAADDGGSKTSA